MAEYEVENLKITLTVDTNDVTTKINAVKEQFTQLSNTIRQGIGHELTELANGFKIFSDALPNVSNAGEAIKKFTEGLKSADFDAFAAGLGKIGKAFTAVGIDDKVVDGIKAFTTALVSMGENASNFTTKGFEKVISAGSELDALAESARKASSIGSGLRDLASGIKNLPDAIGNFAKTDFNKWKSNLEQTASRLAKVNVVTRALSGKGVHTISLLANALKTLARFGETDSKLAEQLNNASNAIVAFAQKTANAISDDTLKKFKELANATSRLAASIKQIGKVNFERILGGKAKGLSNKETSPVDGVSPSEKSGFLKVPDKQDYLKGFASNWKKNAREFDTVVAKIKKGLRSIITSYKLTGKVLAMPFTMPLKGVANGIQKAGTRVKTLLRKLMADITKTLAKPIVAPFAGLANAITSLHGKFAGFLKSVGRIALYRAIRSGIKMITTAVKEGVDNLYNWATIVGNSFKPTMDSLATSALYAKNSLAAMASPLLDALAPALEIIVEKAVSLMNTLNQLFATLTGATTWRRAIRTQAEYSAEIDNTSGALKELKATILGIDEINPLNGDNGSGRGASDIIPDYKGMFEELPISETFDDFKLSFDGLGKKISDAIASELDKINWSTVKSKVNNAVKRVAEFFNGFFGNESLWREIGQTAGEGLNTVAGAMLTFTGTVEWETIGKNIATGIRNSINTIKWDDLGRTAVAGLKVALQTLHGFVSGITPKDWKDLGNKLGTAVSAAIDEIPWKQILPDMKKLADGLKMAIQSATSGIKIDWNVLGNNISQSVADALDKIKWSDIQTNANKFATKFADFLNGALGNSSLYTSLGKTVSNGINTIAGVINTFKFKFDGKKVGTNLGKALKTAISTTNWKDVGSALISGFSIATDVLHGFVSTMTERDWEDLGERLGSSISDTLLSIKWENVIPDLVNFTSGLLKAIVSAVNKIKWKDVLDELFKGIKGADWDTLFKNVGAFLEATWPVIAIPIVLQLSKVTLAQTVLPMIKTAFSAAVSAVPSTLSLTITAALLGYEAVMAGLDYMISKADEWHKETEKSTKGYVDNLYATGRITKEEYEKMSGQIDGMMDELDAWAIGATNVNDDIAELATTTEKSTSEIKRQFSSVTEFWKSERAKIKEEAEQTAREAAIEFNRGLADQKPKIEGTAYNINSAMGQALMSGDPWTWGNDMGYLFSKGLIHSAEAYIAPAASKAAQSARSYLAFSKPDKGPLSDADKYGPDFMELFAEGMEQKAYLIANAAKNIASQIEMSMPTTANITSTTTASLGSDSTALIRSVAQGTEDANTAQNELLREQNELLRQILAKTGDGVTAGAIMSSMERANRRAGVAVATIA